LAAGCRKAADAGIDPTYVSRLERAGENRAVATLEKWAIALDSEMSEFFKIHFVDRRPASAIAGRKNPLSTHNAGWPHGRALGATGNFEPQRNLVTPKRSQPSRSAVADLQENGRHQMVKD
jgi:transcriptional regulator with XRE-family HTH domain